MSWVESNAGGRFMFRQLKNALYLKKLQDSEDGKKVLKEIKEIVRESQCLSKISTEYIIKDAEVYVRVKATFNTINTLGGDGQWDFPITSDCSRPFKEYQELNIEKITTLLAKVFKTQYCFMDGGAIRVRAKA